jgi:tetratricopeptide (TPR) repeat protein
LKKGGAAMAKRTLLLSLVMMAAFCAVAAAQDGSGFALSLDPAITIPLPNSPSAQSYSVGFLGSLNADYVFPSLPYLVVGGSFDYGLTPGPSWTLTTLGLSAGPGLRIRILPSLSATFYGHGGYMFGTLGQATASNPYLRAGVDLSLYLWPTFRLSLGGEYDHQFAATAAQYQGIAVRLSGGFNFSQLNQRARLEIRDIIITPVFPVFYKYYNDNTIGSVKIRNGEDGPISNVRVSFFVRQYMDAPKECALITELKAGEEREVPLFALFSRTILSILEPTKAQAEVSVSYSYSEREREAKTASVTTINHRNGMTWDDDRHVASFATVNDPAVMMLAKAAAGIARGAGFSSFDTAFRQAQGVFEELGLYGIRYVPDANMPYSTSSRDQIFVDYLQFPVQTLQFKSGDCDDMSILFASMLEAGGVESAFITVPGHIFAAFALAMKPEQALAFFSRPDDLIVRDGKAWVPIEVTLVQEGFLRAWQIGAREWRAALAAGQAQFYPTHDAWKLYAPVAIIGTEQSIEPPQGDRLAARYTAAMKAFIEKEIGPRVEKLIGEIAGARKDPRPMNRLGVLYARYEVFDKAEQSFRGSLALQESAPAFDNLGNIQMRRNDFAAAQKSYQSALRLAPGDIPALVGLVRASYELDDRAGASRWLDRLEHADQGAAKKLAYVKGGDESMARAGEAGQEEMSWTE